MLMKIWHRIEIYFHDLELALFRDYILCEHSHARADLKHRDARASINGVGYAMCHIEVCQEVLP